MRGAPVVGGMRGRGELRGGRGMRSLKRLLLGTPEVDAPDDPQPRDVPVTVAAALFLLLLLIAIALL